jgi:hypothetical protein
MTKEIRAFSAVVIISFTILNLSWWQLIWAPRPNAELRTGLRMVLCS